jgi:hypothetical protein
VTRLDRLTAEVAAELIQGPAVAELAMSARERAEVADETWVAYQRIRIECIATGMRAALYLLSAARTGAIEDEEVEGLTDRIEVAWAKVVQHRSAALDDELRDVVNRGDGA